MKRIVVDIETLVNCFVICGEDAESDQRFHYVIWKNRNDFDQIIKFLRYCATNGIELITYNGLAFDSQVLQWMMNFEDVLTVLPTVNLINEIYDYAQKCIKKSYGNEFQDYPEWKLSIKQIDVFKQLHFDNPAKMSSLKWLQCSIDWPNIEDMPFDHTHYVNDEQELGEIIVYCRNDVQSLKKVFVLTKDGTDLRAELSKEYGLLLMSASEPRLAKELFLYFLSRDLGIDRKELKKWSTFRDQIKVSDILLPYISFERQEFQMLLNNFKKLTIGKPGLPLELRGAFDYNVMYRGLSIDYGVGGIHGFSTPDKYFSDNQWVIVTSDVSSYYPNEVINNEWAPAHIPKKPFCTRYKGFYVDRRKFKKGTAKNYLLKIMLNCVFGLSIDKNSFLSDPELGCRITINGQLMLSMLMEMICEAIPEAKPIMMNTDGHEILIPRSKESTYMEVCKKWEKITMLELEHDKYRSLFAFDCNNYIGVFENGKFKCKGRFEFEAHDKYDTNVLHKNKSFLVVAKGIFHYFVNGTKPEDFVRQHRNIFDFCGFARAKGQWKFYEVKTAENIPDRFLAMDQTEKKDFVKKSGWYEAEKDWWRNDEMEGEMAGVQTDLEGVFKMVIAPEMVVSKKQIQKTLRYFMSNSGSKVIKEKINEKKKKMQQIQIVAGRNHLTVFNKFEARQWEDYNIDYGFYVKEIRKEIKLLEKEQLTLF